MTYWTNAMTVVNQARRVRAQLATGNAFVTSYVTERMLTDLRTSYATANEKVSKLIQVEIDLIEEMI